MRPKQPKFTDHTDPDSYYNLNRYYNEAEKLFDKLEKKAKDIANETPENNWDEYTVGRTSAAREILRVVTTRGDE